MKKYVMCALCGRKHLKRADSAVYVPEGWKALIRNGFAILHCDRCTKDMEKGGLL